ncbi:hypothetical protein FHY34_003003 [Xanthomonas arboricola]|nr:hypothetical protein [Xanthomonas arboricola]
MYDGRRLALDDRARDAYRACTRHRAGDVRKSNVRVRIGRSAQRLRSLDAERSRYVGETWSD